jgi:hypothetical protein
MSGPAGELCVRREEISMRIRISYLLCGEPAPRVVEVSPEEYFHPQVAVAARTVRSTPRHGDDFEYTRHRPEDIRWTLAEITDGEEFFRARTQLLKGTASLMTHLQGSDGEEEIIHHTEIQAGWFHTIRTLKKLGKEWTVVLNCLTVENPGQQKQGRGYCGEWSDAELAAFGDIQ